MSLNRPIERTTYLGDPLIKQSISVKEQSSTQLTWTFLQGKYSDSSNAVLTLSDVDTVTLVYSTVGETPARTETITGSVSNATAGEIQIDFSPTNTTEVNDFTFDLTLEKTSGNVIVADANGYLEVQSRAGATSGPAIQTANIVDITACSQSPYQITYAQSGTTFVIPSTLSCGVFTFKMPVGDEDYRGSIFYFEVSGTTTLELRAGSSDYVEGSAIGGAFRSAVWEGGVWVNDEDYNSMALRLIDGNNWRIPGPRFKWSTTT